MFIYTDITYPTPGGAENLIFQVISLMLHQHKIESMIIGSRDSYLYKRLCDAHINFQFRDIRQGIGACDITEDDTLILFSNSDNLKWIKAAKCKIIVWNILSRSITNWNRFGFERRLTGRRIVGNFFTKRLILEASRKRGLLSMDGATHDDLAHLLKKSIQENIYPVPVDTMGVQLTKRRRSGEVVNVSYIGRGDEVWKVKPLKKIAADLSTVLHKQFKLLIYTNSTELYKEELGSIEASNIQIDFIVNMFGSSLSEHINQHSDIHFSMGTSALEGALAGKPTILMDASNEDFPDNYRYRWLHQTKRNTLGKFIDANTTLTYKGLTISEVLQVLDSEPEYDTMARLALEYTVTFHSSANIVRKLITHPTRLTARDVVINTPALWF